VGSLLNVWDELTDIVDIRWVEHKRAILTLCFLTLLLEKVAAATALHSQFA
jgi:hypothetical protein